MSKNEEAKMWYEAWKATRKEDVVIKVKIDVDWMWLALAVILVIIAWRSV